MRCGDRAAATVRIARACKPTYLSGGSRSHHGHGGDGAAFGARRSGSGVGGDVPRAGDGCGGGGGGAAEVEPRRGAGEESTVASKERTCEFARQMQGNLGMSSVFFFLFRV